MAVRVAAWLVEELTTQLLLANHWLQEKNRQKELGVKPDPERTWAGLYHDNGSCLEINNDIHSERNGFLKIVQSSPCLLTDGATQIVALLAPECSDYLLPRARIHDIIRVRKYTIRFTSYGPPDEHLQFVLRAVDWLGRGRGAHAQPQGHVSTPLWSQGFVDVVRQLHNTRSREDIRCLCPEVSLEREADATKAVMPRSDEASQKASQSHTQMAFGTQLSHAGRLRHQEDAPQFLGVNRLEPVLAGNTQREEIQPVPPKSFRSANDQAKLLSLLGKTANSNVHQSAAAKHGPTKPAPSRLSHTSVDDSPRYGNASGTQMLTQLPVHIDRQSAQTQKGIPSAEQTPSRDVRSEQQDRDSPVVSPSVTRSTQHTQKAARARAHMNEENQLQKLASECSWMKDFEFTRENFKVPSEQLNILRKNESWHKPMPGHRFPDGNIPINILTTLYRLTDENAAMDAAPHSEDEMTEDPSPEFPIESVDASAESVPQPTQDDFPPSSQVSWPASPSPEPPKLSTRPNQQLPPDSSFEPTERPIDDSIISKIQDPLRTGSSNENKEIDPPSSPPMRDVPAELDDDVEMEECVPQGLGEDSIGGSDGPNKRKVLVTSPPPRSVVQVKETPYFRTKKGQQNAQDDVLPAQTLDSSNTSKHTSSTSIVCGTYNDKSSSDPQIVASRAGGTATTRESGIGARRAALGQTQHESTCDNTKTVADDAPVAMNTYSAVIRGARGISVQQHAESEHYSPRVSPGSNETPMVLSELTPVSAQISSAILELPATHSPHDSVERLTTREISDRADLLGSPTRIPGPTKRKHDNSPPRQTSRQLKRREIKITGFRHDLPNSTDPESALRHYREESLRKYREARTSGASVEFGPEPASIIELEENPDAMQIDPPCGAPASPLSSLHESLYQEPSPAMVVPTVAAAAASVLDSASFTLATAPRHNDAEPSASVSQAPLDPESDTGIAPGIFASFKAAYPEYTGDTKHFRGQCVQIIKLDEEDKMVPKWQWDDFIIRNRTDYKDYAFECIARGEDPEPYHRFYKDAIRDTIYRKGIIESRSSLLQALQQLNVQPLEAGPRNSAGNPSLGQPKPSSVSLPSAFNKGHRVSSTHDRPRHSLPAKQPHYHEIPSNNLHTPKAGVTRSSNSRNRIPSEGSSRLSSRLSRGGTASLHSTPGPGDATIEGSDPFRDFVFAYHRTTSFTGSAKVDPNLPWPRNLEVRPSIADMTKRKVDVLKWQDKL